MKMYAALGDQLEIRGDDAIVLCRGKERILTQQELLIWLSLMWHVSTFAELYRGYCEKAAAIKLCPEMDFNACLQRLQQRNLIREGSGYTRDEALYDLLSSLLICPLRNSFFIKTLAFFGLLSQGRSFREAKLVFSYTALSRCEREILGLANRLKMSTVEIIRCIECGADRHSDPSKIAGALYANTFQDSALALAACRTSPIRQEVLAAVTTLYQKQKIVFQ